jgi:hypothetical protein
MGNGSRSPTMVEELDRFARDLLEAWKRPIKAGNEPVA